MPLLHLQSGRAGVPVLAVGNIVAGSKPISGSRLAEPGGSCRKAHGEPRCVRGGYLDGLCRLALRLLQAEGGSPSGVAPHPEPRASTAPSLRSCRA
jgi:hypothetical protein